MRILIIEDSPLIRRMYGLAFSRQEHELVEAEDGRKALAALGASKQPFDGEAIQKRRRRKPLKAATTRKRKAAGQRAATTRKRRDAGRKAATTRRRRSSARKAAATRMARTNGRILEDDTAGD